MTQIATVTCPQCGKENIPTFFNGMLEIHQDQEAKRCQGSYFHPVDLPRPKEDLQKVHYRWVPGMHAQFNP